MASNPEFIITSTGLRQASIASPTGPHISITQFKVGSAFGYSPTSADTALHGTILHTGIPFSYAILADNTLDIRLVMDVNVGPFTFGEVGIFLADGTLFALAAYTAGQQKLKHVGNQMGSRYEISALLRLTQAPAVLNVSVTNMAGLLEVPNWEGLVAPSALLSSANAAIVHEVSPNGHTPVVFRATDFEWDIKGYHKYASGSLSGTSTTNTFTSTVFTTKTFDSATNRRYLVQFLTSGTVRSIQSINGTVATINGLMALQTGNFIIWEADEFVAIRRWASKTEYNKLVAAWNPVWGTPNGFAFPPQTNSGWNQTPFATLTIPPTAAQWNALQESVRDGADLVGIDRTTVVNDDFLISSLDDLDGFQQKRENYDELKRVMNAVIAEKNGALLTSLETITPTTGQRVRTNNEFSNVNHVVLLTYESEAAMLGAFNAGAYVAFFQTLVNPQTAEQTAWKTKLETTIGTTRMNYDGTINANGLAATAIGMYDLTGSYQVIFTHASAGSSGTLTYQIEARKPAVNQLEFRMTWTDDTGPYTGYTNTVGFTSFTTIARPSSLILNTPVSPYPTAFSSGTL